MNVIIGYKAVQGSYKGKNDPICRGELRKVHKGLGVWPGGVTMTLRCLFQIRKSAQGLAEPVSVRIWYVGMVQHVKFSAARVKPGRQPLREMPFCSTKGFLIYPVKETH